MSFSGYKFARIYMSGFQSAPIDKATLAKKEFLNGFVSKIEPRIRVQNISIFSDYDFNFESSNYIFTGSTDIYNSKYSSIKFTTVTGSINVLDSGVTNPSGFFIASGYVTGQFINAPSGGNVIYENIYYPKSDNLKMIGGDITIGPPVGYREKIYLGQFTGIATFNDYFYSVEDQTITFIKKVQYTISGTESFNQTFTVLNTISINGEIPTINTLDTILRGKNGFVSQEQDLTVYGYIQNYPLLRNNISGFGLISGSVSGVGTGIINFNRLVSGQTLSAFTTQPVGYRTASGVLNYNSPILGDFIILTNDATGSNFNFIYETGQDFTPPVYFNSINTLNNIINSGSGDYSVKSTIQNNNLILQSLIPGAEGNLFRVISQGSTGVPAISGEYFTSGITYRNPITPTGIFTGLLNTGLYVTGYFQQLITGTLVKDITGLIGYRPFTGLWDLYEVATNNGISEYINIKNTGIFTENKISTNYTGYSKETVNRRTFSVSYTNSPDFASVDVVKLNISLNSGISGYSYNIILTGNTQLNTTITVPTGNTIPVQ